MVKEVCYKLNKSSMLYKRIMSKHLERLGITYSQLMVLKVVNQEPGITAKEILLQMDTDKATLSGVLARLERDNLIYREVNPKDKRVQNIYVSPGSEHLCSQVGVIENACVSDMMAGVTDGEVDAFVAILDKFIENQIEKIEADF